MSETKEEISIKKPSKTIALTGFYFNSLGSLTEEEKTTLMEIVHKLYFKDGIEFKVTVEKTIHAFCKA